MNIKPVTEVIGYETTDGTEWVKEDVAKEYQEFLDAISDVSTSDKLVAAVIAVFDQYSKRYSESEFVHSDNEQNFKEFDVFNNIFGGVSTSEIKIAVIQLIEKHYKDGEK